MRGLRHLILRVTFPLIALRLLVGLAAAVAVQSPGRPEAEPTAAAGPVLTTEHFAIYSDLDTNLNDALITAGHARGAGEAELFHDGEDTLCFAALQAAERAGWDRAVDFYSEVISPHGTGERAKVVVRLSLAGIVADEEWSAEERNYVSIVRGLRAAARPAYQTCRWPTQDAVNRRWIEALSLLLAEHEHELGVRLAEVFATPWQGLPFRVDVVKTADWSGAHTMNLRPTGAHTLISSSNPGYQGVAALEMIFHEACHFLTGRGKPLPVALQAAAESGSPFHGNLVHAVHFWMTGEVVRRVLEAGGEAGYTPSMYALGLFEGGAFRSAIESTWPAYLDGKKTLSEAANDLLEALRQATGPQ